MIETAECSKCSSKGWYNDSDIRRFCRCNAGKLRVLRVIYIGERIDIQPTKEVVAWN